MSSEILELYVFIHYNWQYEFLRPSIEEIVKAYLATYGSEPFPEDLEEEELYSEDEEDDDEEDEAAEGEANDDDE